jgi:hypothetical protein
MGGVGGSLLAVVTNTELDSLFATLNKSVNGARANRDGRSKMSEEAFRFVLRDVGVKWLQKTAIVFVCSTSIWAPCAFAQDFLENTFLLDVSIGSSRSKIARDLSFGGYELTDGTPVYFSEWYTPRLPDLNFIFLTQLTPSFGLSWGFSLGESGEKYRIDPGIWLGFIYRHEITRQSSLTISALTLIGGNLQERSCVGDYGEIGGIQQVNCRLAASTLPPAETLQFLVNEKGYRETRFSLRYEIRF